MGCLISSASDAAISPQRAHLLASLSSESLNQFTENITKAEALSIEVASIFKDLRSSDRAAMGSASEGFDTGEAREKSPDDEASVPLSVFEHSKR